MAGGADTGEDEAITGINVTPLVDIVLVLLIIFMVTAKLIVSKSVPLDLPKAASGSDVQTLFSVVLAADGTTQVDSTTVPTDDASLGPPLPKMRHEVAGDEAGSAGDEDVHGRCLTSARRKHPAAAGRPSP